MNIRPGLVRHVQATLNFFYNKQLITRENHHQMHELKRQLKDSLDEITRALEKLDGPCDGEAHSPEVGGMIDNCLRCAPLWGTVLKKEYRK